MLSLPPEANGLALNIGGLTLLLFAFEVLEQACVVPERHVSGS